MSYHQSAKSSFFLIVLFMLTLFFFSGCNKIKGQLLVMEANMQESRQRHIEAISTYSEALRYPESAAYAEYGLGLVYLFLGEDNAAFTRFGNAAEIMDSDPASIDAELSYRLHYNRGILHFHAGSFDEAASEFRKSLEIDPGRIEAKRNLELSLLSMEQQNSAALSSSVEIENDKGKDNTLFEYLRKKEIDRWNNQESTEDQDAPWLDY